MTSDLNFRKHSTITQMIYDSPTMLCLVPTTSGVVVPASVIVGNSLTLQIGHGLTPPIPDLAFGPESISCTLAFAGLAFTAQFRGRRYLPLTT